MRWDEPAATLVQSARAAAAAPPFSYSSCAPVCAHTAVARGTTWLARPRLCIASCKAAARSWLG